MSDSYVVTMSDRGEIIIPTALRVRRGWTEGTCLIAIDAEIGVIVTARADAERLVQNQLAGANVVSALIEGRRRAAAAEHGR